jgi:hypothetical protein
MRTLKLKGTRLRAGSALTLSTGLMLAASCSNEEIKPRGELMVAVSTDLSIVEDMNQVGLEVFDEQGRTLDKRDLDILPAGDFGMPGTIALIPPDAGGQRLRVRVSAKSASGNDATTSIVREAIVRVPTDRIALLRMPLYWLCKDQVKPDGQAYSSSCDPNQTCKEGVCVPADVAANDMPDYSAALVFGGGNAHGDGGYCLDVDTCFGKTDVLPKPSDTDCSVPLPKGTDPDSLNVALVLPPNTDGHCLDDPIAGPRQGNCYIPLDQDPAEGYAITDGRIVLPPQACVRQSVVGISISTVCRKKDLSVPICGPWTGWNQTPSGQGGMAGTGVELAGASGEAGSGTGGGGKGGSGGKGGGTVNNGSGGTDTKDAGASGEGGAPNPSTPCPAPAQRADAYYYVLLDRTPAMQTALATVRQALQQFGTQTPSAGIEFGLETTKDGCQGDYSQPELGFALLPQATQQLPNLQPSPQQMLQLDDAMTSTLQTLQSIQTPISRTLVVITSAYDAPGTQGCGALTDVMRQAETDALAAGVSLRPIVITGQNQPNLMQGFQVTGAPQPVQMSATNLQAGSLVSALASFRDAVVPCTFVAPSGSYGVRIEATDGSTNDLTNVGSSSGCGSSSGYYPSAGTFVLCPSTCTAVGSGTVETVTFAACENGSGGSGGSGGKGQAGTSSGNAGRSTAGAGGVVGSGASGAVGQGGAAAPGCPNQQPQAGARCTMAGLLCPYGNTTCICAGTTWMCQ